MQNHLIPNPNISDLLSTFDYIVFILITSSTFLFVLWGNTKKKNVNSQEESFLDLMLMGRQLTLPMFIATLVATWYGGIFGVSRIAFENGIFNFVSQGIFWYLTYFIFAFFVIDKIKSHKAMTLPDLIGDMFGPKSKFLSGIMNVLNLVPIVYTISLGLLLEILFGVSLEIGIVLGVSFVLVYSFFGGMRSIVYSDIFQFFVMIIAVVLVILVSLTTFGLAPLRSLPASYFHPMGTYSLSETFAWGLIALSTLVDPNFYQRCFAANSFKTAKKGILISTGIWVIFDLCLTIGAMYAKAIIPDANPENGYFIYALQILPNGLRGLFLAGITATILSTLDSYIFLAGSTIAYDLVPKRLRGKIHIHHIGVLFVALLSIVLAMVFEGNIKNVWKTLGSISSSAILIPVVLGYLYKNKFSDMNFIFAASLGAITTVYWRLSGLKELYALDEIYIGMSSSLLGMLSYKLFKTLVLDKDSKS